ncbi:MAG: hypothetical protein HRT88_08155, partial [Lentisphaeraceae bacterium]|nr:hypothetical protein [Lentisphaeraceae bacterium]
MDIKKIFLVLSLFINSLPAVGAISDQMIKGSISALSEVILQGQNPDGSWASSSHVVGETSLCVLALSTAGITEENAQMKKAIAYLLANFPPDYTYSIGLYACALQAVDQKKYKPNIKRASDWLVRHQKKGTWNYSGSSAGDNSITHYDMLGL